MTWSRRRPGRYEVRHLRVSRGTQEDILRLYVPVDYPALVGEPQSLGDLRGDLCRRAGRQSPILEDAILEGAAGRVLHSDVVGFAVLRTSPIIDVNYVRVVERGCAPSLTPEALDEALIVGVLLLEDLEGDVTLKNLLVRQEDLSHTSAAQRVSQTVAAPDKGLLLGSVHLFTPFKTLGTATDDWYTAPL